MQKITEGRLCTTQAVLKQVGINGVAMTCVSLNFLHWNNELSEILLQLGLW